MVLAHCPRHEGSFAEELKFKESSRTTLCDGQRRLQVVLAQHPPGLGGWRANLKGQRDDLSSLNRRCLFLLRFNV